MSTQLRLLAKTERRGRREQRPETAAGPDGRGARGARAARIGRVDGATARRRVHWEGSWRLDDRTRRIGRAGVASARQVLARAHPESELRRAS